MDALSEVLSAIRLTGATLLNAQFGSPWCVTAGSTETLARGFLERSDSPAIFHLIVDGECDFQHESEAPLRLRTGDLALVLHGDAHRLGQPLEAPATSLSTLVKPPIAGELVPVVHGGRGSRTRVITGVASFDRRYSDPLLAALPRFLRVSLSGSAAAEHWRDGLGLALSGSEAPRAGGIASLARLAELAFIEALRQHVDGISPDSRGWLAGLGNRYVGRALALMHARPEENWTVEKLGRQVGLSRSALAERFTEFLGEPPIAYLTHWRLRLAAQRLAGSARPIAAIAKQAGYESSGAFSHAFRRAFGEPPSTWRRKASRTR